MQGNLKRAFHKIKYEPEPSLARHICLNLVMRDKRIVNLKIYIFSFIGTISFLGLIPVLKMLISDFSRSGFYEYLTLTFSSKALFSAWKELTYSIAESLPATSLMLAFGILFIFILSLRFISKQITRGQFNYKYL
jgi:hypothetical protein